MSDGEFCQALPLAEWQIEDPEDRHMVLERDFFFIDGNGKRWPAPIGYATDGASIPRALWTVVGAPFTGRYRRAAIVHDVACDTAGPDPAARRAADRMFFHACRAGGCGLGQAIVLYLGVRVGSIWAAVPQWSALTLSEHAGPRFTRTATERKLEDDFSRIGEHVMAGGATDDIDEIERRADQAIQVVTGIDARAAYERAARVRVTDKTTGVP